VLAKSRGFVVPLGLLFLSLAVLMGRVGNSIVPRADFFEGLFVGIATGLSVIGLLAHAIVVWDERQNTE
jgi:hypothetical protein